MRRLIALGAQGFVELGTGSVLRGLLRSLDRSRSPVGTSGGRSPVDAGGGLSAWSVGDPASLVEATAAIAGGALGSGGPPAADDAVRAGDTAEAGG
jgi:hypothetical protein